MDNNQLRKLEKNLTKSAKKAKQYWVRGMVGFTEADQGFFPIEAVPVLNTIQGKHTTLAELIEDCGKLNNDHKELKLTHEADAKEFEIYKEAQIKLQQETDNKITELSKTINEIIEVI